MANDNNLYLWWGCIIYHSTLYGLVDGGFSAWDEWGTCTAECGGGDQTRSRRCDNPVPEFGGLECDGDFTECQRCNLDPCPSTCPA